MGYGEPVGSGVSSVVVVGAGPAGLMAALTAARQGRETTVLEAARQVGGMAASFEIAGQRVDYGSHRLHPSIAPELLQVLSGLLGTDLQTRRRNGRLRLRDRWVAFPLQAMDMARRLPPSFLARSLLDTALAPLRARQPDSFADGIASRLGPTVLEEVYAPFAKKLYGVEAASLSIELANRRVSARSAADIARKVLGRSDSGGRTFLYPRKGYGQISEALADAAVAAGASIHTNTQVVEVSGGGVATDAGDTFVGDLVLSTIPLPILAAVMEPGPPEPAETALGALRTRAMLLVYLVVPRDRYTPFDAHYLPGPESTPTRVSEPKNYRSGDDPRGRTVLCAEIPCFVTDPIWRATDEELAAVVTEDLRRVGLPSADPVHIEVRRLRWVYPVYERSTESQRAEVERWAANMDGVVTFGRQGLGVPDNVHHVLAMGSDAAELTTEDGLDLPAWRDALAGYRSNVVED